MKNHRSAAINSVVVLTITALLGCKTSRESNPSTSPNATSNIASTPPQTTGALSAPQIPPSPPGSYSWAGVSVPWKVFDGSVPDTPPATAPGRTFYCDPVKGNDKWDGSSVTFVSGTKGPKRTINAVLSLPEKDGLKPGDVVLLAGGIYREYLSFGGLSGKPGLPITIGSYGHGTGAPILDGGLRPNQWTKYTGTGQSKVWQTSMAGFSEITPKKPVLGIYVNNGKKESALKEVIHGQVSTYGGNPLPPNETQNGVKDGNNKWFYEPNTKVLYADFGGTLGEGDPNTADISVLWNSHASSNSQMTILLNPGSGYFHFIGLTVRAASWSGVYARSSGNVFDHCDFKFNGGAAALFATAEKELTIKDNVIKYSRIWMNILENWPRFNNGYTGGGWPSAVGWEGQSNGVSLGNIVYENGGEGVDFTGTGSADGSRPHFNVNNITKNNIIYDNFSVNLYLVSVQGVKAEQNLVFNHPLDPNQTFDGLLQSSAAYGKDLGRRLVPINVGLGDEPGSSFDHKAYLADITLINNVFVGAKRGFMDWDDGTADKGHALKDCFIANNTFVLSNQTLPDGSDGYGFLLQSNPAFSKSSVIVNNVVVAPTAKDDFLHASFSPQGAPAGISVDYNLYSGNGKWAIPGSSKWNVLGPSAGSLDKWKSTFNWDQHSVATTDIVVADIAEFDAPSAQKPMFDWTKAKTKPGAPGAGAGMDLSARIKDNFTGAPRAKGAFDIGAF